MILILFYGDEGCYQEEYCFISIACVTTLGNNGLIRVTGAFLSAVHLPDVRTATNLVVCGVILVLFKFKFKFKFKFATIAL
jgi:hypothetical protein